VPCWPQTRWGKSPVRTEQKLGTCCLAWCPELGHNRSGGTWGRSSGFAAMPVVALPRCSYPQSFSGVQGSASMLGCCPTWGIPRRAGENRACSLQHHTACMTSAGVQTAPLFQPCLAAWQGYPSLPLAFLKGRGDWEVPHNWRKAQRQWT